MTAPIETLMMNSVEWELLPTTDSKELHATHQGVLELLGHKMKCFRLSDGQTVFEAEDFKRFCAVMFELKL